MPANPADRRADSPADSLYVGGKSVRGASHIREKLPNQDSIAWTPADGYGWPICLAVADGHGSPKCFRSADGSRLAVKVMVDTLSNFAREAAEQLDKAETDSSLTESGMSFNVLSVLKSAAQQQLPQGIVREWRRAVEQHLKVSPFSEAELAAVDESSGSGARAGILANPALAYGSTVMGVLVTSDFSAYLQLGDGDILLVAADGEISPAVPHDDRLMANETTSLSMEQPWRDFRVTFQIAGASPPELVLVSTDGCANSFRSHDDFLKIGGDILTKLQNSGLQSVLAELEPWLNQMSANGSGDDITFGIIYRNSPERPPRRPRVPSQAVPPGAPKNNLPPNNPAPGKPAAKPSQPPPAVRPRPATNNDPPFYIGFVRQTVRAWNKLRGYLGTGFVTVFLMAVVAVLVLIGRTSHDDDQKNKPTVEINEVVPQRAVAGAPFTIKLTGKHLGDSPLNYQFRRQGDERWIAADRGMIKFAKIEGPPGTKLSLQIRSLADGKESATLEREWPILENTPHRLTAQSPKFGPSQVPNMILMSVNVAFEDDEQHSIQKVEYCFPRQKWTEVPPEYVKPKENVIPLSFNIPRYSNLGGCDVRVCDAYGIWSKPITIPIPPHQPGQSGGHALTTTSPDVWIHRGVVSAETNGPTPTCLAVSKLERVIAVGYRNGDICVYFQEDKRKPSIRLHPSDNILALKISENGNSIDFVDSAGNWCQIPSRIHAPPTVRASTIDNLTAASLQDGMLLVGTDRGIVEFWSARTLDGPIIHRQSSHKRVDLLCFIGTGGVPWSLSQGSERQTLLQNLNDLSIISLRDLPAPLTAIAANVRGDRIALTTGNDVRLIKIEAGMDNWPPSASIFISNHPIQAMTWAPDDSGLYTVAKDGRVVKWEPPKAVTPNAITPKVQPFRSRPGNGLGQFER